MGAMPAPPRVAKKKGGTKTASIAVRQNLQKREFAAVRKCYLYATFFSGRMRIKWRNPLKYMVPAAAFEPATY